MRPNEYIIEGNPGAGKSSVLSKVVSGLTKKGLRVNLAAPFRDVKEALKKERGGEDPLYDIWQAKNTVDAQMALRLLRETVTHSRDRISSVKDGDAVLLFDRGWLTLLRALEDMGTSSDEVEEEEEEKKFWLNPQIPDTFFITTPPTVSIEANRKRDLKADWRSAPEVLTDDYMRRADLVERFRARVIRAFDVTHLEQDRTPIAEDIQAYVLGRIGRLVY